MKSGFIAVVGRPNVGKSTLVNKLISEKVAIVSNKAGTTRDSIRGILNHNDSQFIFIDTPGIHKPKHLLGEHMTNVAIQTLKEAEVVMFLLDGSQEISTGDLFVNDRIIEAKPKHKVLVINKIDKITDEELEEKYKEIEEKLGKFDNVIRLAAEYSLGIHQIPDVLSPYLEEGFWYYPDDMYTDMPQYKVVTEVVREKILQKTRDEIPHSIAVEISDAKTKKNGTKKYDINIYVERNSQKGIVIGKNGELLKQVGIEARHDLEEILGCKIYLNLWVKVKEKWRKKQSFLRELGYNS